MTEETKKVWFHCGKCGSLFLSDFGPEETRICEECSQNPSNGVDYIREPAAVRPSEPKPFDKTGEAADDDGRRSVRKKRRTNTMMRIIVIWTFIMLLAVWVRHQSANKDQEKEKQEAVAGKMTKGTLADERIALLNSALPDCHRALGGFLTAGTPEGRNQFVADPIETAGKMATFYANNSFPQVDVKKLTRSSQDIIKVGKEWMISTRWKEKDGIEFDAVFRRDRGKWKLDWEHFNRYSDYPWTLFLSGDGPDQGEFRLLLRKLLTGDEVEQEGARLGFVMLAPEFGKPGETGMESPEFIVNRRSDEGLMIEAAFDTRQRNESPFDVEEKPLEAADLIRVRVLVKRENFGGVRSFTLEKVIACHWIDSEVSGYDIEALRDDLFGN